MIKSPQISRFALRAWKFLLVSGFVGIAALLAFGYHATRQWQEVVAARVTRQNEESTDLMMKAIARDMRGAQTRILANRDWAAPEPTGRVADMTEVAATTFARFPYLESFFTSRAEARTMTFFSRANRLPAWMPREKTNLNSPIALATDPPIVSQIQPHLAASIAD